MNVSQAWSWRAAIMQSDLEPTTRHVLLTISMHMNEKGEGCYPSQELLAAETGLSREWVSKQIKTAVAKGWLLIEKHGFKGRKWKRNEYLPRWPERDLTGGEMAENEAEQGSEPRSQPQNEDVNSVGRGCELEGAEVVNHVHTNFSENISENLSKRAQARGERGDENPDLEKGEGQGAGEDGGEALRGSGKAAFKAAHASWPTFTTDSTPEAEKAWFALSPAERVKAADEAQRYVAAAQATGRKLVCSFGVYLREKRWEKLAAPDAPAARLSEPPFGPAWCAERIARILAVRPVVWQPKAYQRQMLAEGKIDEAAETRAANLAARAWALGLMDEQAAKGNGAACAPESIAAGKAFGKVERDSALWHQWLEAFAAQGWPWLPDMGKHWGAYFPAEGPDGFFAQG